MIVSLSFDECSGMIDLPLRSITERDDKLQAHNQNTSISKYNEDIFAHIMTEWIELFVSQRTSNEVESEIEISLQRVSLDPSGIESGGWNIPVRSK